MVAEAMANKQLRLTIDGGHSDRLRTRTMQTLRRSTYHIIFILLAGLLVSACDNYGVHVNDVTEHELAGVLKGGGFPANQECEVEHSYYSLQPPPNSDTFRAYAIHLAPFPKSLLVTNQTGLATWQSGADTNELHMQILAAAELGTTVTTNVSWLPPLAEFSSTNYYRYFAYHGLEDGKPNPVVLYAYNLKKQTLYHIRFKY